MRELFPGDPGLSFWAPEPVQTLNGPVRLERFPPHIPTLLAGQIGPLANLRSHAGTALVVTTNSPWLELRMDRLRHHQMCPQAITLEIQLPQGPVYSDSGDLREREGNVNLRLNTGLTFLDKPAPCWLWLPPISTLAVASVALAESATILPSHLPEPRLLAIGDSLVQGFSCASPIHTLPYRVGKALGLGTWNLGVGGLKIEPQVFAHALTAHPWDTVIVGLGSNHAWRASDLEPVETQARSLADLILAQHPRRALWILPPWKPCEDGKGPPEFHGVPLDSAAAARLATIRHTLRHTLAPYAPHLTILDDPLPHDHRYYPDGLHPFAPGFAKLSHRILAALGQTE